MFREVRNGWIAFRSGQCDGQGMPVNPGRPMRRSLLALLLWSGLVLTGCRALGWRFGPGFSLKDPTIFAAPPAVVRRDDGCFLTWIQGSTPFYFHPGYRVLDGRLVFSLQATSSTGSNGAGRRHEVKIEGAEAHEALQRGAYWWEPDPEPDGSFVRLTVIDERHPSRAE